jgi:hypothetical protein
MEGTRIAAEHALVVLLCPASMPRMHMHAQGMRTSISSALARYSSTRPSKAVQLTSSS